MNTGPRPWCGEPLVGPLGGVAEGCLTCVVPDLSTGRRLGLVVVGGSGRVRARLEGGGGDC